MPVTHTEPQDAFRPSEGLAAERNVYRLQVGGKMLCETLRRIADGCEGRIEKDSIPALIAQEALNHKEPDPKDWAAALRTQEARPEAVEDRYLDRVTGRPVGDHGTAMAAIRYALDCEDDLANRDAFLRGWRDGDLSEWPEYYSWLENVEPVETLSEQPRTDAAGMRELMDLRAFRDRVVAAVEFAPQSGDDFERRIEADLRDGLSLRKCAAKHGTTVGIVRGVRSRIDQALGEGR